MNLFGTACRNMKEITIEEKQNIDGDGFHTLYVKKMKAKHLSMAQDMMRGTPVIWICKLKTADNGAF